MTATRTITRVLDADDFPTTLRDEGWLLLKADAAAGATTITVSRSGSSPLAAVTVGQQIAIGSGTSTCEVRRVTVVSGTTLTLNTATKWAHTSGQMVRPFAFWASPLWWGAQPVSTVDSFRNLSNMFIDQQTAGIGTYGILGLGHIQPFYSTRPLWVCDFWWSQQFGLIAKAPFGIDCTLGVWNTYDNWPHQLLLNASGQFGTVTAVDTAADGITFSTTPGSIAGDEVAFYVREGLGTIPAGLEEGRTYYLKTNITGNKWTLSIDKWGTTTVDITDVGSGEVVFWSTGSSRVNADRLYLSGGGKTAGLSGDKKTGGIRGLGGFRGTLQQQSRLTDPRFENFANFAAMIDGQQSNWYNPQITLNARGGFRCAGGKYITCVGGNFEANDINLEMADMAEASAPGTAVGAAGQQVDVFNGTHFENPGRASFLVQTITISGTPTAGTFDLKAQLLDGSSTPTVGTLNWNATNADIQTVCDTFFGAGNTLVTGGPLPGGQITITFQGVYQYGWGLVLSITNSITGGSYTVSLINPNGRQISFKGGLAVLFEGCIDSTNTNPVTNTALDFLTVEGAAATSVLFSAYELRACWTLNTTGNMVNDTLRRNLKRADNDSTGCASFVAYWLGAGRHDLRVGRHWWLVGDGGRGVAFGTASTDGAGQTVPTWEIFGAASQQQQLLRLLMGTSQTGNPLEVADALNNLLCSIDTKGLVNPPALRALTAAPAYSASITPDASAAQWQTITVTNGTAFTINAPTNPPTSARSQDLTIEILNSSGGAMGVITWNAAFVFAGVTWANPASTKKRFVTFRWNGTKWVAGPFSTADY